MTLTVGSLFSGIGGLELGLERAGMTVRWQVEIDDYATRVLTKHWPNVPKFRDVRAVGRHNLEPVDLICGGFPCQPHSLAGKRQASEDERDLWGEFARLIGELKPGWVVAENVPGLLSSSNGRFFGNVLRDLAACGYDAEWDSIPAFAVGAPHRRDRVFIVAYPQRLRPQTGIFGGLLPQPPDNKGWQGQFARSPGNAVTRWGWTRETVFHRVVDGVPNRIHRLRGLGNAVVPQVAEYIGNLIIRTL